MADLAYYKSLEDYEKIKDYLDLDKEGYEIPIEIPEFKPDFSKAIIVDNLPLVGKDKIEKLSDVILKIYVQISDKIAPNDFYMPFNEETNLTMGFSFIKFSSKEEADKAVQVTNGFALSKTNIFKVSLYSDLQIYEEYSEEYIEPFPTPFKPRPDVVAWLTDTASRDQFLLRYSQETEICWANFNGEEPSHLYGGEREKVGGKVWCESFVQWSPQGTYLATYHGAGIKLWGNNEFEPQSRYIHADVEFVDFSPCENYMTTYRYKQNRNDDNIIVWDIRGATKIRPFELKNPLDAKYHVQATVYEKKGDKVLERLIKGRIVSYNEDTNEFTLSEGAIIHNEVSADKVIALQEPNRLKWSSNGKYLARVGCDAISVYAAPSFLLLDRKSIAAKDVQDFVWSPKADVCMLSYWAPASGNHPSLISILQLPERTDICSRKIFDVTDGKMVWQSEGDYLCAYMTKISGKKRSYMLMFFRVCEVGIPVEQIELNEPIISVTWEPAGDRVCVVHGETKSPFISFYSMSGTGGATGLYGTTAAPPKAVVGAATTSAAVSTKASSSAASASAIKKELTFLYTLKEYQCNSIVWSPAGDILALAFNGPDVCTFHIYDVENNVLLATRRHDRGNRLAWDPSGRLLASCTINPLKQERVARAHPDDGFVLFSFQGNVLCQVRKERLIQFEWRPRPKDLLTQEEKKKAIKNLKKYERLFEKEDKRRQVELNQELNANRRKVAIDFLVLTSHNKSVNAGLKIKRVIARSGYDSDDESNYIVEVSMEEEIVSTKEQIIQ